MIESNYHLFFGMFADKLKADIVAALMRKPMDVSAITHALHVERSRVSHALLVMGKCSVVKAENKGRRRVYCLNEETVKPLVELVDRHVSKFCKSCWAKNSAETKKRS